MKILALGIYFCYPLVVFRIEKAIIIDHFKNKLVQVEILELKDWRLNWNL